MEYTRLGSIGKPHGLRGAFILSGYKGDGVIFDDPIQLWVSSPAASPTPFTLRQAKCISGRWVIQFEEISDINQIEPMRGAEILCATHMLDSLTAGSESEFPIATLAGSRVVDAVTEEPIGILLGIEDAGAGSAMVQRWWIQTPEVEFSVPAHKHFVVRVDAKQKKIALDHWRDLKDLSLGLETP